MDELNVHFEGWTQSSVLVLVPRVPAGGRGNNRTQILTLSGLERLALFSYCSVMDQGLLPVSVTQLQSPCGRCQRTGGSAQSSSVYLQSEHLGRTVLCCVRAPGRHAIFTVCYRWVCLKVHIKSSHTEVLLIGKIFMFHIFSRRGCAVRQPSERPGSSWLLPQSLALWILTSLTWNRTIQGS